MLILKKTASLYGIGSDDDYVVLGERRPDHWPHHASPAGTARAVLVLDDHGT